MILVKIITLPVMPFIVAYRNREEHPIQAKILYIGWGVIYALVILVCILDS